MTNKMSHDRVHFTIPRRRLENNPKYRDLLREVFGYFADTTADTDLKIVCRPSQFARFIVLRHTKYGLYNLINELDMRLVRPKEEVEEVDVSNNPNRVQYDEELAQ